MMSTMRGRFAPSPTGAMHLGNARTALLAWLAARRAGGAMVLRIEDLDRPRVVSGAEERLMGELAWLGLDWDEGPDRGGPFAPYRQSERTARYDDAVAALLAAGRAFPCACSRADVARAASAPHEMGGALDTLPYPGTCRDLAREEVERRAAAFGRAPVIRFRATGAQFPFRDGVHGEVREAAVDDFVLRRADGIAAYQLAVVVDDAAMQVTDVVRGDDLLHSTARQLALYQAVARPPPRFAHVPLLLANGGERLAKRTRPVSIADLRAAGVPAETIVGALAASAHLCPPGTAARPAELVQHFDLSRLHREPAVIDPRSLATSPRD
jgi:glutamyl-tRNA synthetase